MDLAQELRAVVKAFAAAEIPYALVGGLAVAVNRNLASAFEERIEKRLGDTPLSVISRAGLIRMKLQAGRPQDQMDVIKLQEMDR